MRFAGQVVVVTGASAGIGAACARRFVAEGASCVLAARGAERLEALAAELRAAGGDAIAVPTDVVDRAGAAALIEAAAARHGRIDVLVNNAGLNHRGPIANHSPDHLAAVIETNLIAPLVLIRLALPHLRRAPAPTIVNVASLAGRVPLPDEAAYSASKFGLRALSFALAEELRPSGVRVAVVSPGPVDTGFIMGELDDVPDLVLSQPVATADAIAALVVDSAADGRRERVPRRLGGYLTTAGYLFPSLGRALRPLMERRGRRQKERFRRRAAPDDT